MILWCCSHHLEKEDKSEIALCIAKRLKVRCFVLK